MISGERDRLIQEPIPSVSADKFDFVFFADIDNDNMTERVHYYLQNDIDKKRSNKTKRHSADLSERGSIDDYDCDACRQYRCISPFLFL